MKIAVIKAKKIIILFVLGIFILLGGIFLPANGLSQVFYGGNLRQLPIYSVGREDKKVAISFDCAWGVDYTDKILAVLKTYNVKTTFFTVEFWTKKYPEYILKISNLGHEIGTHSSTHPYMSKLSKSQIEKELCTSIGAIEEITGKKVNLFRAPYGDYNDLLINTAREMGLYTIQWDVDSLDWKDLSASEITNRVLKKIKSGSIVLFHNQGLHTAESLPNILTTLLDNGYSVVPISELIYKDNYTMDANGRQILNR